jgi:hypothetical protein
LPGDSTGVLREFLERGLKDACVLYIVDPEAVAQCLEAGEGAQIELSVGAKSSPMQGEPVLMKAQVVAVSCEGKFRYDGPMYEGSQFLQQFLRRQQELTLTIGPVSFQGEDQRLFIDEAQSAAGDGRSDHVAAEPLEPTSVGGLDAGGA